MKKIDWDKTGCRYMQDGIGHKKEDGFVEARLQFEDGEFLTARITEISCYAGRERDNRYTYEPSLVGNSRGEEIRITPKKEGTALLHIQTLYFSAMEIDNISFTDLMRWVKMLEKCMENQGDEFWKEEFEIPTEIE